MFAHQRESDEDVDEDDMTIGELQRIKEMTSSGSDLETDTESTFEEKKEKVNTTDQYSVCCHFLLKLLVSLFLSKVIPYHSVESKQNILIVHHIHYVFIISIGSFTLVFELRLPMGL